MKKLIRDGYEAMPFWKEALSKGKASVVKNDDTVKAFLVKKIAEELRELEEKGYASVEEFGDVIDVIEALMLRSGIDPDDVLDSRIKKRSRFGSFYKGLLFETDEQPLGHTVWPGDAHGSQINTVFEVLAWDLTMPGSGASLLWRKIVKSEEAAKERAEQAHGDVLLWRKRADGALMSTGDYVDYRITPLTIE